jgi:histidinol phosphatase-like enzyme
MNKNQEGVISRLSDGMALLKSVDEDCDFDNINVIGDAKCDMDVSSKSRESNIIISTFPKRKGDYLLVEI